MIGAFFVVVRVVGFFRLRPKVGGFRVYFLVERVETLISTFLGVLVG